MDNKMYFVVMVVIMAGVTALIRFLPFIVFKNKTPKIIIYLGKVLPFAIMGMLVVYCLKGTTFTSGTYGIPEIVSCGAVMGLHKLKHNTLLSIIAGTACYMLLIRLMG